MKQPNNLRNRWRRYSQTRRAYGFAFLPFRRWARGAGQHSEAYGTQPGFLDEPVALTSPSNPQWKGV